METSTMITEFEQHLKDLGFSFQQYPHGYYIMRHIINVDKTLRVKLVCSEKVDASEHGSRNGNQIQSIREFNFNLSEIEIDIDFFILGIKRLISNSVDFLVISPTELKERFVNRELGLTSEQKYSMVFWLVDDKFIYDSTNIGIEGEWYFIGRSENGRLAAGTHMDYSEFLNNLERLTTV